MRNRGYVFEKKGLWGRATVYADFVRIIPSRGWIKTRLDLIRRLVRRKNLRDYHITSHSPLVARNLLSASMRRKWYVMPYRASDGHIKAFTEEKVEMVMLLDKIEPWPINATHLWIERTHDGVERHFLLSDVLAAQDLYDSGNMLALKLWIVDALALGNVKFATALSRCVSEKVPSGKFIQPMDMFAFWAEEGNIFAHTAFGEKVRLFKPEEVNVATSHGFMYWRDFKTHSRRSILSALRTYF